MKPIWKHLIVAVAVTLALLLAACAPAAAPGGKPGVAPGAVTPSPKGAAVEGKYGGILTIGADSDPPHLDTLQNITRRLTQKISPVYNGLVQYDPSDPTRIVGDLAERWDISPDGTKYTFYLRKGVKWHDGKALTSEDVKWSWDRYSKAPEGFATPRAAFARGVDNITTPDKDTVVFNLKFPQASLLALNAPNQTTIVPKHVYEEKGDMKKVVVGSGPFKFEKYDLGSIFEVKKNPDYFVKGRPYLDGIQFIVITDAATRVAALRGHRLSMLGPGQDGMWATEAAQLKKDVPQINIVKAKSLSTMVLYFNQKSVWSDVKLRKAAYLALDRDAFLKAVCEGEGEPGPWFAGGTKYAYTAEELKTKPGWRQPKDQDLAEAKKLLGEAGYANGLDTSIMAITGNTDRAAEFYAAQLGKIGVKVKIEPMEYAVYLQRQEKHTFDLDAAPRAFVTEDPDNLDYYWRTGGSFNWGQFSDAKVDELLTKQSRIMDFAERKKAVQELKNRLEEAIPWVASYWFVWHFGVWPEVKNFTPGWGYYNNNKYQDVWLDK